jgi:outer membrane immunogenic protein
MKRALLAGISALAMVTVAGAANAADLPRREAMPVKAPIYSAPYNWTGFYLGINGGGAWGSSDFSGGLGNGSSDPDGGMVGGTIGYNWQFGQTVFGLEGDIDWSSVRGSSNCGLGGGFSCETRNDYLATVRGRLGYAFDRFMPYVTGGVAIGNIKASVAGLGSSDETQVGWTVGGGLETAIAGGWTAKIEYLYVDLGNSDTISGVGLNSDADFTENVVRAGFNYRF